MILAVMYPYIWMVDVVVRVYKGKNLIQDPNRIIIIIKLFHNIHPKSQMQNSAGDPLTH